MIFIDRYYDSRTGHGCYIGARRDQSGTAYRGYRWPAADEPVPGHAGVQEISEYEATREREEAKIRGWLTRTPYDSLPFREELEGFEDVPEAILMEALR